MDREKERMRGYRPSVGHRGAKILSLDPDPELEFSLFGDSGSGFGSSKKWNRNTYPMIHLLIFLLAAGFGDLSGSDRRERTVPSVRYKQPLQRFSSHLVI